MFVVRDSVLEDVPAITRLINAVMAEGKLAWDVTRTEGDNKRWMTTLHNQRYPCLSVFEADRLVGIGALESYWDSESGSGVEYTCRLIVIVDSGHRRQGIATSLFQRLQEHEKTASRHLYLCMRTHSM